MPQDPSNEVPGRLKSWLSRARSRGSTLLDSSVKRFGRGEGLELALRNVQLKNVQQYSRRIQWGLLVVGVFLLSDLTSRAISLFIRPTMPPVPPKKAITVARRPVPIEDYDAISRRNIFNVEGKIPDPFDQGQLDCFSQARQSTQKLQLLGTIVMNDDIHSVALMKDESNPVNFAVSKDDIFSDGKYQMMKIERKKVCFQIRATQDLEFIEIPDDSPNMAGTTPTLGAVSSSDGIIPVSENEYQVKNDFLQKNLLDLNNILQTARAVPYIEPGSGKFKGFLIQSIDANSPFAQLGIKQGDILTGVNDIVLDNAGKGLEAFQRLRNSPKIGLKVIRGGEERTMSYDVK